MRPRLKPVGVSILKPCLRSNRKRRSFSLASASGQGAEEIVREALPELQLVAG